MPRTVEIAIQSAISRKGVAVVVLPGDIVLKEAVTEHPRLRFKPAEPRVRPTDSDLQKLVSTLTSAEKVTILAGAGCAGAHQQLIDIAEKLKAPIVHAMRAKNLSNTTTRSTWG